MTRRGQTSVFAFCVCGRTHRFAPTADVRIKTMIIEIITDVLDVLIEYMESTKFRAEINRIKL